MNSTMQLVMIGLVTLIATDLVSYSFARMVPESCGYLPPNQPYRQLIHSGTKGGYATGGQWPWMAFVSYKERECDRRIGKEEKGGGISVKDMPAEDVVACENACKKELRCTRFKFDKILRHCWLKKAFFYPPSIFETNWDVISGTCGNYYYDCGGAIIDREWILTAGHCLRSEKASDFCVVVGHKDKFDLHYENCTPLGRRPLQVIRHPIYNQTALGQAYMLHHQKNWFRPKTTKDPSRKKVGTSLRDLSEKQWQIRYHDIGLIKMAPIPFATPNVGRICLPTEAGDYHDRSCYVAGWGDTETGRTSEYLKTLRSRIWRNEDGEQPMPCIWPC